MAANHAEAQRILSYSAVRTQKQRAPAARFHKRRLIGILRVNQIVKRIGNEPGNCQNST